MYLNIEDIQFIQMEHSTRCNLDCLQCARTLDNWSELSPEKAKDLSLEDYKILLAPFDSNQITLFHCGNYGDALSSPTFDETLEYCISQNVKKVNIATNGSLRSPNWWANLAKTYGKKIRVTFSIDGLKDTNPIYRVGSDFLKIMANAEAFIAHGGTAWWDFIEFGHNYKQIEIGRQQAVAMGFAKFSVKYTSRFASQIEHTKNHKQEFKDTKNNKNQKSFDNVVREYGNFSEYINQTTVDCKQKKLRSVFVDMNLRIWPCCWMAASHYNLNDSDEKKSYLYLEELYGKNFNSLREYGWDVLRHDFFSQYLNQSWTSPSQKYRRIYTCGFTCGQKFESSSAFGENKQSLNL